jgi:hypothetical protein
VLSLEKIKELLEIDETSFTGLRWKISATNRTKIGDSAGSINGNGYLQVQIGGKKYYNHRIIYALYHNIELDQLPVMLDHIDCNPENNRISNIRACTQNENQRNKRKPINNTSDIKGVCWHKQHQKWHAQISVNNKVNHIGYFKNILDAADAYKKACIELHGEFARPE